MSFGNKWEFESGLPLTSCVTVTQWLGAPSCPHCVVLDKLPHRSVLGLAFYTMRIVRACMCHALYIVVRIKYR